MAKKFNAIDIASRMKTIIKMYDEVYDKLQELEDEANSFDDYISPTVYARLVETSDDLDMSRVAETVKKAKDLLEDHLSDVLNNRMEYYDALVDAIFDNVDYVLEEIVIKGGTKVEKFIDNHPEFSNGAIKDYLKTFDVEQLLSNYCNYGSYGDYVRMGADVLNDYCADKGISSYVAVQDVDDARTISGEVYKHILTFTAGNDVLTITVGR